MSEPVYVRPVPACGHVRRWGTPTYIGCRKQRRGDDKLEFAFDEPLGVIAIPFSEWVRFAREYRRAVESGALVVVDAAAYKASQVAAETAEKKRTAAHPKTVAASKAKKETAGGAPSSESGSAG